MNEQHEVVLLVADKHREQWLHGVLSHISKIHLCFPKAEDQNRPAVYLTDEVSYQRHLDAFSQLRAHITPDSPALLFLLKANHLHLLLQMRCFYRPWMLNSFENGCNTGWNSVIV